MEIVEGKKLSNYIILEIIEYICKMMNDKLEKQDITILVQNDTTNAKKSIIEIARKVKRIQIVTPKINKFKIVEDELEAQYGLSCQITYNKRKSLSKSKIIVNIDYLENDLNQFVLNKNAILIDINNNTTIHTKAYEGIHIYSYNIMSKIKNDSFDAKNIIETMLLDKTYEQIRMLIKKEDIKITSLIGKNGIINKNEYIRTQKTENFRKGIDKIELLS